MTDLENTKPSNNKSPKQKNKSKKKNIPCPVAGVAHILSTFNNNMITMTDVQGNVIAWSSAGAHGFKGSRKSTAYAGQVTASHVAKIVYEKGMRNISVTIRGLGIAREAAVRSLYAAGLAILSIKYEATIPHNGCKSPKKRRV